MVQQCPGCARILVLLVIGLRVLIYQQGYRTARKDIFCDVYSQQFFKVIVSSNTSQRNIPGKVTFFNVNVRGLSPLHVILSENSVACCSAMLRCMLSSSSFHSSSRHGWKPASLLLAFFSPRLLAIILTNIAFLPGRRAVTNIPIRG